MSESKDTVGLEEFKRDAWVCARSQLASLSQAVRNIAEHYFPEWEAFRGIETDVKITVQVLQDYSRVMGGDGHLYLRDHGDADLHWYDGTGVHLLDFNESPLFIKELTSECCLNRDVTEPDNLSCWDDKNEMKDD